MDYLKDALGNPSQPEDFAGVVNINASMAAFSEIKILSDNLNLGTGAPQRPFTAARLDVYQPPQSNNPNSAAAMLVPGGNANLAQPNTTQQGLRGSVPAGGSNPGTTNPGTTNPGTNTSGGNNPSSNNPSSNNPNSNNPSSNNSGGNTSSINNPGTVIRQIADLNNGPDINNTVSVKQLINEAIQDEILVADVTVGSLRTIGLKIDNAASAETPMIISAVTQNRIEPVESGGFVRVREFTPVSFKPLTAFRYQLPQDTFEHRQTTEQITITATLKDGSALPSWLSFSSTELLFTGTPPEGSDSIVVVIVATDSEGDRVSTEVVIDINATS